MDLENTYITLDVININRCLYCNGTGLIWESVYHNQVKQIRCPHCDEEFNLKEVKKIKVPLSKFIAKISDEIKIK